MLGIFVITYSVSLILNTLIYKKKLNFVNVSISVWFIFAILSIFNFYDMYVPNEKTYIYILIYLISFQVFSFIFYKTKYKLKVDKTEDKDINWKIINYAMLICIGIMSYLTFKGLNIYLATGSFSDIRNAYLNYEIISNKGQMLLSIGIIPLGTAIGLYALLDYIENGKIRMSLFLYIIFLAEVVFTTGGRNKIVFFALIIVIALLDKYKNNIFKIVQKNFKIVIALIIIFLIILSITLQRNLSGGGFLYNIYAYFAGSIHLFGVYLNNPDTYLINTGNYLNGQVLISGFFYPISFIMRLFGSEIKAGIYIVNEVTQIFVPISNNTMINNNVTCLYSALRDFGEYGLVIYSMIISLMMVNFYKKKEKSSNLYNKAMYYYYFANVIFLLFDFNFSNPSTIFTFIYVFILNKCKTKKKE